MLVNPQLKGKSRKETKIETGQIYTPYYFSQWALDPTKIMKQKELNHDLQIFSKYNAMLPDFPRRKMKNCHVSPNAIGKHPQTDS